MVPAESHSPQTPRWDTPFRSGRKEPRFAVNLPAYVSSQHDTLWGARGRLSNLSASGLLIELPALPPLAEGTVVKVEWPEAQIIGEVRHVTCRPGFVRIGVSITSVLSGQVLLLSASD